MAIVRLSFRALATFSALVVLAGACSGGGGGLGGSATGDVASSEVSGARREVLEGFGSGTLVVEGVSGDTVSWPVMVAADRDSRRRGLMGVTDLDGWAGMVFVFDSDVTNGFWMKDTLIPLTVVYLDSEGHIVSATDMEPCPSGTACPVYPPDGPYRMALEVSRGDLDRLGIGRGSILRLEISQD